MGLIETSVFWRLSVPVQCVGLLLCIVGYATDHQVVMEQCYAGLWDGSFFGHDKTISEYLKLINQSDLWLISARAFMGMALCLEGLTIAATFLRAFVNHILMALFTAILAFVSVGAGLIGCIIMVTEGQSVFSDIIDKAKLNKDIFIPEAGWSFEVYMAALGGYVFAGLLHLLDWYRSLNSNAPS